MIICKGCGHENETDDQFCGSCGSFLEWAGAKVDEVTTTGPDHAETDTDPTLLERVRKGVGVDEESIETYRASVREQTAAETAADQAVADQVVAEREAALEAARRSQAEEEGKRALAAAELARREAEEAAERAEQEAETARLAAAEAERQRLLDAERERAGREQAAREAAQLQQAKRLEEIETGRLQAEAAAQAARAKADEEARAEALLAEAAKEREVQAEQARRDAQTRLSEAVDAAAAAALRSAQEHDALAAAHAAREAADADARKVRSEAEAATALAQEEMAKARAEAAEARAEAALLRSQAEGRNAEHQIASARATAEAEAERTRADAIRQAESDAAAARVTADAEAEANAIRSRAEADAQAKSAEAEAMRLRAEAAAAKARAEAEQSRQQAEADAAARSRQEALRRASALVAKPVATSPAATATTATPTVPPAGKPKGKAKGNAAEPTGSTVATGSAGANAATGASHPGPQLPGAERSRPAPKRSSAEDLNPGDLVCGQCGIGNPPSRKFCRRCGTTLAEATVVKLGFFARLRRRFSRKPKTFVAGHRAKSGAGGAGGGLGTKGRVAWFRLNAKLLRLGAMLGVVAVLGFGVEPIRQKLRLPNYRQTVINKIREFSRPVYDPVRPSGGTATSSAPDHPADLLIDNGNNTYWAAAPSANGGVGSKVTVRFEKPFDLGRMLLTSGVSGNNQPGEGFVSQPRPSEIKVTLNGDAANVKTVALKDIDQPQTLMVKGKAVTNVEFVVSAVYPAAQGTGKSVAITEMEFFQRRKLGDDFETLPAPGLVTTSANEGGAYIIDDALATAWTSSPEADGVGQGFTVTFPEPVDLDRIRIAPGHAEEDFEVSPRPHEVQLVLVCAGGCEPTMQVRFDDKPGFKTVKLTARGVTSIQVQVRSVYGTGGGVAFAEAQFQRKRPKPL